MTETVIKGSGNSRSIKSVPNLAQLAPTYDKLLELLTGEGLPVDLGPLNPAGLAQRGTDLNKASLLSDETAALYPDLPEDPTVDDVLAVIWPRISKAQNTADSKIRTETCQYTGTGTYGAGSPNSITFSFAPKLIFYVSGIGISTTSGRWLLFADEVPTTYENNGAFGYHVSGGTGGASYSINPFGKKSPDGKTFYWYVTINSGGPNGEAAAKNSAPAAQLSATGITYKFLAIG